MPVSEICITCTRCDCRDRSPMVKECSSYTMVPPADWERSKQVGGSHYRDHKIQPWDIVDEYRLSHYLALATKYILRNKDNRVQDLEKAIHCIEHEIYLLKRRQGERHAH